MEKAEVFHGLRSLQYPGVFLLFVHGGSQQAGSGLVLPFDVALWRIDQYGGVDVVGKGLEVEQAAFLALQVGAVVFQRLLHAVQQFRRQAAMATCMVAAEGFGKLRVAHRLNKLLHEA